MKEDGNYTIKGGRKLFAAGHLCLGNVKEQKLLVETWAKKNRFYSGFFIHSMVEKIVLCGDYLKDSGKAITASMGAKLVCCAF